MTRRLPLVLLATAPLMLAAPAHAAPDPAGVLCGFSSVTAPGETWQIGEVDAGPLVLGDDTDPATVYWGSVTCTIQTDPLHGTAGNDLASLTGSTTPGVVSAAGTVAYEVAPEDSVYLCTQVDIAGGPTLYWDVADGLGSWSTSSDAACSGPGVGPEPEPLPAEEILEELLGDSILCPVLATVLPPQGDIPGLWDCPPYET